MIIQLTTHYCIVLNRSMCSNYCMLCFGTFIPVGKDGSCMPKRLNDSISPTRHPSKLASVIKKMCPNAVAMIIYTDGGPDHNNKHISVRLGLLALFLDLDLDAMVVMRTAPTQIWAKPVERVMSTLNLGLQRVALARCEMEKEYEDIFKQCKGMKAQ